MVAALCEAAGELDGAVFHGEVEDRTGTVDGQGAEDGNATADGVGDIEGEERFACLWLAGEEEEAVVGQEVFDEHGREVSGVCHQLGGSLHAGEMRRFDSSVLAIDLVDELVQGCRPERSVDDL